MKTYTFKVVLEPDENVWQVHCPTLDPYAAATWGVTTEEALRHIHEVIAMIVEELTEEGIPIPEETSPEPLSAEEQLVTVTV